MGVFLFKRAAVLMGFALFFVLLGYSSPPNVQFDGSAKSATTMMVAMMYVLGFVCLMGSLNFAGAGLLYIQQPIYQNMDKALRLTRLLWIIVGALALVTIVIGLLIYKFV